MTVALAISTVSPLEMIPPGVVAVYSARSTLEAYHSY